MIWFFLLSGLFLGWSLGANDAANVFGTAVGTRMVRFRTAALVASLFVVLGAVIGGAGTSFTLGKLGAVNALAGSFTVALAAGLTITWMTRMHLPVSTSQAIVGAIVGWNLFTGTPTDFSALVAIVSTWIFCPLLAAGIALVLFYPTRWMLERSTVHLLVQDTLTRTGLLVVGALGSYSLGANNIANVMGVFVPAVHFPSLPLPGDLRFTGAQQLFLMGALAISLGIFTFSRRTMATVGRSLFKLTPVTALLVVLTHALVLLLFSSESLERWLALRGLPTLPLVPVSSSQAVIGAVMGISLAKGGRGVNVKVLGRIASGWVTTPIAAGLLALLGLFFVQNVFEQTVVRPQPYAITPPVIERLERQGLSLADDQDLPEGYWSDARELRHALFASRGLRDEGLMRKIFVAAELHPVSIDSMRLRLELPARGVPPEEVAVVKSLHGQDFRYRWQLAEALAAADPLFRPHEGRGAEVLNKELVRRLRVLHRALEDVQPR